MEDEKDRKVGWREILVMFGPSFRGTALTYALSIFFIIISALALAAEPIIYGKIVDVVIGLATRQSTQVFALLMPLVALWAGSALVGSLTKELSQTLSWKGAYRVLTDFTERSFERVLGWDPERFGRISLGALSKRLDKVWDAAWTFSARILTDIVPTVVTFAVFLAAGVVLDWRMTLVSLAGVPILCAITLGAYRYADAKQEQLNESWEETSKKLSESIQSIMPIKAFVAERAMVHEHARRMQTVTRNQESLNWTWTGLEVANSGVRLFSRMAVVIAGLWFIQDGSLSVGTLVTFLGMVSYILAPFDYLLADVMRRLSEIRSAFGRIADDWFVGNAIVDAPNAKRLRNVVGELTFEDVSVRYRDNKKDTVTGITVRVRAGSSLAVVGASGSGKSTFVKLINRFMDPSSGRVLIDGHDLRDVRLGDLRRSVGVVQQDTVLFNDSIFHNIKFANPSATRAQVIAACKKAQAHDFIVRTKNGYDTVIGERGVRLSGGERQRIALARVFLANPPILVLDESTSALDSETEHKLQIALRSAMENRTTIIIAHRLSTVYMADQIAVIDKGKLAELGTHTDLIREGGIYEHLWRLQSGGYLPD